MSDGPISIRLGKAATEFNVGVSTIVDFLHKKGFKIDSNPNTKLSPEMHSLLVKEYQPDKAAKDIAKHIELEYQAQKAVKTEEKKPQVPETAEVKTVKESVATPPAQPKAPVEVPVAPKPVAAPAPVVEKTPEPAPAPAVEAKPVVIAPPAPQPVKEEVKPEAPKAVVPQPEPVQEQKVVVAETPEVKPQVAPTPPAAEPVITAANDDLVLSGPKVLGTIDLKQFDKKPKKKEKAEKGAAKDHKKETAEPLPVAEAPVAVPEPLPTPAPAPVAVEAPVAEQPVKTETPEETPVRTSDQPSIDGIYNKSDSNFLQTKFTKLEGPKF